MKIRELSKLKESYLLLNKTIISKLITDFKLQIK